MKKLFYILAAVLLASLHAQQATTVGSPTANAGGTPSAGPGSGSVTSVSIVPSDTVVGTVTNPTTTPAITLTALGVTPPASGNQLVSGGGVDAVVGLQMTVGAATYVIQGTQYTSPKTTLSAAAADPTNPRTDVVYVDSTGTVGILEGTPGNPAITPQVDPTTQLQLTTYDLAAGATVLPVTVNDIYHDNAEWTTSKVGTPINLASTNNPYRGSVDIEGTAAVAGNSFTFTAPYTFDPGTYATLFFYVAPKASWPNPKQFSVQLLNSSGTVIGSTVVFKSGSFGFNSGATANVYQQVAIPVSLFGANGQTAKGLKFTLAGGGSSIGFYMDDFTLQAGLSPTVTSNAMVWKGPYSATTSYNINDVVTDAPTNTPYVAIAAGTGHTPASSPTFWQVAGNVGIVTNLTGPITSVGNATSVASQTGTGSTFVMNTAPTIAGGTLSGTTTQTGTTILTPNALSGTVINVAQRLNTKTVGADTTFTFSGTPSSGQWFGLELTNSDSSAHTITIPSSFLVNATPGGTTTTQTLPASGKIQLNWRYDGSVYNLYAGGGGGTPGGSSGDYQYNNAGALGGKTPGTGVDTAFQIAVNTTGGFATYPVSGTSPLTTKGDLYTFSTVNARLGVGSNGSILTADSAASTGIKWTTPTYPNTATSGKVLIGDGTNIVLSTPTFPNASSTSGKIIKSDGTNWVASTETYAAPGTSGNVLTSDGTNWTSAAPASSTTTVNLGNLTGTINIDWSTGDQFYGTLTGNTTFTFSNAPAGGKTITIRVNQTGTNTYSVTWPSMGWPGAVAPTMTGGLATRDTYTIIYMNSVYDGSYIQNIH